MLEQLLQQVKARLIVGKPRSGAAKNDTISFLGTQVLRLKFIETDAVETAATNGEHVYYSPRYLSTLTEDEIAGIVAHEVMHCMLLHCVRRGSRLSGAWNWACDIVVNETLKEMGFAIPSDAITLASANQKLNLNLQPNLSAEDYYEQLKNYVLSPVDLLFEPGPNYLLNNSEWRKCVKDFRKIGNIPNNLQREIDTLVQPEQKITWQSLINTELASLAILTESWHRPNKRFSSLYLPSNKYEYKPRVLIAVDTSASISKEQFSVFIHEVKVAAYTFGIEGVVAFCDAEISQIVTLDENFCLPEKIVGEGGTCHDPIFKYAEREDIDYIVCLTDGYTEYTMVPRQPVLWVVIDNASFNPPFGRVVHL